MSFTVTGAATDIIGIFGVLLYLASYTLLQLGYIRGQSYAYASLTMASALCILLSLAADFNLSSALVNGAYVVISLVGMARLYLISRRSQFNAEEADLRARKLSALSPADARRFMNQGSWTGLRPGDVVTREGERASQLVYISSGEAMVIVGDVTVAVCGPGSLVGELTVIDGDPATATVVVSKECRAFGLQADLLRRMILRDPDLKQALTVSFAVETRRKLIAANEAERRRLSQQRSDAASVLGSRSDEAASATWSSMSARDI